MAKNALATGFTTEEPDTTDIVGIEEESVRLEEIKFQEVELLNLEGNLPIGLFLDGERLNKVTLHPYSTKHDRILGQLLKGTRNRLIPALAQFLPQVIKEIGGYPFTDIAKKMSSSPTRVIENMFLGDVLTIVLMVRQEAQGADIAMAATCPNCGTKNEDNPEKGRPYHNLESVIVKTLPNLNKKLVVEVTLEDGLDIFEDHITKILMQPLKLYHAEKIAKTDSGEPEDISMIYAMVVGIPESEAFRNAKGTVFNDDLYDQLSRNDLKIVRRALKVLQPGPAMSIEMDCYNCGHEWEETLGWGRLREFLYIAPDSPE